MSTQFFQFVLSNFLKVINCSQWFPSIIRIVNPFLCAAFPFKFSVTLPYLCFTETSLQTEWVNHVSLYGRLPVFALQRNQIISKPEFQCQQDSTWVAHVLSPPIDPRISESYLKVKINFKFLFSHFFVVPPTVLWRSLIGQQVIR